MAQRAEPTTFAEAVEAACGPVIEAEGYELVLVEYVARSHVLRLFIDRAQADAATGVSLDDCTRVTHVVSDLLDSEGLSDMVSGRYTLEVSSPGLDRPLVKPQHYQRFVGQQIRVVTRQPLEEGSGRRKYSGTLVAADEQGALVEVGGHEHRFAYGDIEHARLVPEF